MIIIIIFVLVLYVVFTEVKNGPTDSTNAKGYPTKTDESGRILDRIEWMALRNNRVNYLTKFLLWAVWVTFFSSFLFLGKLPSSSIFFRNWIVTFITMLCLRGYYYWHSDKFSDYAILDGVNILRERMNVEAGDLETLDSLDVKLKGPEAPFTFTHEDYAVGSRYPTL